MLVCVVGFLTGVWLVVADDERRAAVEDGLTTTTAAVGVDGVLAGRRRVLAGASGFLIGFGAGRGDRGQREQQHGRRAGQGFARNRISAMIQDLAPSLARAGARDTPSG